MRCQTGKEAYGSRGVALEALRRCKTNNRWKRAASVVYLCPHCDHFHITSHPRPKGRLT